MYYKVKSFCIKNGNELWVTAAANNVRPLTFFREQYEADEPNIRKKLKHFAISIWEGNFQPYSSCPHKEWWQMCQNIFQLKPINIQYTSWERDRKYNLNRLYDLLDKLADEVLVPTFMESIYTVSAFYVHDWVKEYDEESKRLYDEVKEKYKQERKIIITTAWRSNVDGFDVLITEDNKVLFAKASNYNNRGLLDDNDCSAVDITEKNWRDLI